MNPQILTSLGLLAVANVIMTVAWYWHLKHEMSWLPKVILISWVIALFEYSFQVPANRIGYAAGMTGFQLKITAEVMSLTAFTVFAIVYLGESLRWNHVVAFAMLLGAVFFAFGFKAATP